MAQSDDADARPPGPSSSSPGLAPQAPPAVRPGTVRAIVIPYLAWTAVMALIAFVRLVLGAFNAPVFTVLFKDGSVILFLIATVVAVVGVIQRETSR